VSRMEGPEAHATLLRLDRADRQTSTTRTSRRPRALWRVGRPSLGRMAYPPSAISPCSLATSTRASHRCRAVS
jgi:hypothetical protein